MAATSTPDHSPLAQSALPPADQSVIRAVRNGVVEAAFRPMLDRAAAFHRHLVRARAISGAMVGLQRDGRIGYHTSSIGEEAAVVGAVVGARDGDWMFPSVRDWYVALARGLPLATYMHHAFGSAFDPTKGHAAPDHAPARAFNVAPPSGVMGAHLPQAVGAAWAAKIKRENVATIALFGAEVMETGDFHNALNFAGVFKTPTVFVCRTRAAPTSGRTRTEAADRAAAYGLASARVDGTDVLAVAGVVREAVLREGATFVEVLVPPVSYDGAPNPLDLGPDDPLTRFGKLIAADAAPIAEDARVEIDAAVAAAVQAGPPGKATIFEDVYASLPAHLAEQRKNLIGGPDL